LAKKSEKRTVEKSKSEERKGPRKRTVAEKIP